MTATLAPPRRESLTVRLVRHCRSAAAASADGTFALGYRDAAVALGATAGNARKAIGDLVLAGTIALVAEGRANHADTYRLSEHVAAPRDPSPQDLADRLATHCAAMAAASPDGRFELLKATAAEAIDANDVVAARAISRLLDEGRILRLRKGKSRLQPLYAMAGSAAAEAGPVAEPGPAVVRCTVCGMRYVPDGLASACPRTLKWPHLRGLTGLRIAGRPT